MQLSRRQFGQGALALAAVGWSAEAGAGLPASLQAELVVKLAPYDRGLRARAADGLAILLVKKAGDAESERLVGSVASALAGYDRIGGIPHREEVIAFTNALDLAAHCRAKKIAIAYIAPEVVTDPEGLRAAFDGVNVLTIAPSAELAQRGAVVLAFDLVSSRPKLFVNLTTAQRQAITLASDVLKLMTVVR